MPLAQPVIDSEVLVCFAVKPGDQRIGAAPRLVTRVSPRTDILEGSRMGLVADSGRLYFFDPDTGAAVGRASA